MALFGRKGGPPADDPGEHRSKRGGARRPTQDVHIDLTELEKRAAPAPGLAPTPQPGAPAPRLAPAVPGPRSPGIPQSTRRSGRPGRKGTPIGELLVKAGAVNTEQLTKALRTQEQKGGLVGQILREMGACTEQDVSDALSKQFRFTQVDLSTCQPTAESLILIPAEKCRELRLIAFECVGEYICVAMVNVLNRKGPTQVENLAKLKMKGFKSSWPQIKATIDKWYTPEIEACVRKAEEARTGEGGRPVDLAKRLAADLAAGRAPPAAPAGEAGAPASDSTRRKRSKDLKASVRAMPAKPPADVQAESFTAAAEALRARGRLEDALRRLEAGAAAVPESAGLQKMLEEVRAELAEKRAGEAERRRRVAELLDQGRASRDAADLDAAVASFGEAAELEPQNNVIQREVAVTRNAIAKAKAEAVARREAEEEERAAEERRKAEEEERRKTQVRDLLKLAGKAQKSGDLAAAAVRVKDVLSLDPKHAGAKKRLAKLEAAPEAEADAVLRMASEDREAGRLEVAKRKLAELAQAQPEGEKGEKVEKGEKAEKVEKGEKGDKVKDALSHLEADFEKRHAEEEARRKAEEEKLRKAEEDLRERASALAEADADRRQTESVAAQGGETRLEAGAVDESSLIVLSATPDDVRPALARIVASMMGIAHDEGDGAAVLQKLPVARQYARTREELGKLAEAVSAVDAAFDDEEEVLVPGEEELGLELEPSLEPQPPMPDLEEQLEAEAEVLEAEPVEDGDDEEIAEAEVVEAIPESVAPVALSEAEYDKLKPDLEPDPIEDWYLTHAAGGPVPAASPDE